MHLPKNAGTTLHRALRWKYGPGVFVLDRQQMLPEEIEDTVPSSIHDATVVIGHLPYGVHRYIRKECDYITLLREPVARVISMYYYVLEHPDHRLHDEVVRTGMDLEEFVRSSADPVVDDQQTRLLAGKGLSGKPVIGRATLEQAERNLESFLVVGLKERFDETFVLMRRALGWKLPMYVRTNVTAQPQLAAEPVIELIRDRNQLDLELYEFARELFAARVAEEGASFRREVAAFNALNRIPDKIGPHVPLAVRRRLKAILPR